MKPPSAISPEIPLSAISDFEIAHACYFKKIWNSMCYFNFFFGLINSPEPPDHLPMLEASEIPVEML